jgi:hypothetical protein
MPRCLWNLMWRRATVVCFGCSGIYAPCCICRWLLACWTVASNLWPMNDFKTCIEDWGEDFGCTGFTGWA